MPVVTPRAFFVRALVVAPKTKTNSRRDRKYQGIPTYVANCVGKSERVREGERE